MQTEGVAKRFTFLLQAATRQVWDEHSNETSLKSPIPASRFTNRDTKVALLHACERILLLFTLNCTDTGTGCTRGERRSALDFNRCAKAYQSLQSPKLFPSAYNSWVSSPEGEGNVSINVCKASAFLLAGVEEGREVFSTPIGKGDDVVGQLVLGEYVGTLVGTVVGTKVGIREGFVLGCDEGKDEG